MTVGYWPNRYWPEYWPTYWPLGGEITPIVTPDCRIYMIGAEEDRSLIVLSENRTLEIKKC